MTEYNDRLIPDIGKCFLVNGLCRFTCSPEDDYEEISIGDEIKKITSNIFIIGNQFQVTLSSDTKKNIIKHLFSNDDQIAIILNYQDSPTEKHVNIYNLMQGWRNWISEKIAELKSV